MMPPFFLFLIVSFFSCHKGNDSKGNDILPTRQDGIWPLALNNEWNYRRIFYKIDGTVESFADEQTKITDMKILKGQPYFGNKLTGQYFTNVGSNTVRGIAFDSLLTDPFAIIFQRVLTNDTIIWRIDDVNCVNNQSFRGYTGVTTINGHECLRNERLTISCNGTIRHREVFYVKPGLGLVKFEEHTFNAATNNVQLRVGVELFSYKLY